MPRFKIGDTVVLQGRRARVVWLSENANEIEAMDEYIVEFENKQRQFIMSSQLQPHERQSVHDRERDSDSCQRQTY
jgi:hypothetical protein